MTFEPLNLVVIRHDKVTLADVPALFDGSFGALGAAARQGVIAPIGPAIAVYSGDPSQTFDLEIGFPVDAVSAAIELGDHLAVPLTIEAGSAFVSSHIGGYDGLAGAWGELAHAALAAGAEPTGRTIEAYVTEPSPDADPSTLRTDLILPVA